MAPLTQAVCTSFIEERGEIQVYSRVVDKLWSFDTVPLGGYLIGCVVDACVSSQAQKKHTEIVHLSAHFYRVTSLGPFEIQIHTKHRGALYTFLTADLIQKNKIKITAQLIFKTPSVEVHHPLTLLPPSPYARRVPLHTHPSSAPLTPMLRFAGFTSMMKWAEDKAIEECNRAKGQGKGSPIGGGGLEWGAWMELTDPAENITISLLPFLGEIMMGIPKLLPWDDKPHWWHPTMVYSLEYKAKIPDDPTFSKRTVGLYSSGRFMHEGRHEVYVEIWTAPTNIGEGVEVDGWREKQVCLAITHQMALTVSASEIGRKMGPESSRL